MIRRVTTIAIAFTCGRTSTNGFTTLPSVSSPINRRWQRQVSGSEIEIDTSALDLSQHFSPQASAAAAMPLAESLSPIVDDGSDSREQQSSASSKQDEEQLAAQKDRMSAENAFAKSPNSMEEFIGMKESMDSPVRTSRAVTSVNKDTSANENENLKKKEVATPSKRRVRASVKDTGMDSLKSYLSSICNHDLLNKNEEIILAREIQILIKWEEERELLEEKLMR